MTDPKIEELAALMRAQASNHGIGDVPMTVPWPLLAADQQRPFLGAARAAWFHLSLELGLPTTVTLPAEGGEIVQIRMREKA